MLTDTGNHQINSFYLSLKQYMKVSQQTSSYLLGYFCMQFLLPTGPHSSSKSQQHEAATWTAYLLVKIMQGEAAELTPGKPLASFHFPE
jgi:hypothetical protein